MQSEKTNHHFPSDDVQDRIFVFMNENTQDPCVDGTVVFRGQRFTHHCFFDKEEIALVMASYPTSFQDIEYATLDLLITKIKELAT